MTGTDTDSHSQWPNQRPEDASQKRNPSSVVTSKRPTNSWSFLRFNNEITYTVINSIHCCHLLRPLVCAVTTECRKMIQIILRLQKINCQTVYTCCGFLTPWLKRLVNWELNHNGQLIQLGLGPHAAALRSQLQGSINRVGRPSSRALVCSALTPSALSLSTTDRGLHVHPLFKNSGSTLITRQTDRQQPYSAVCLSLFLSSSPSFKNSRKSHRIAEFVVMACYCV